MGLSVEAIRSAVATGLPRSARWPLLGNWLDYDFSIGHRTPRPLTADDFHLGLEPEWLDLLVFGEYDYAEGGGANPFLCVRNTDGVVVGLDVERTENCLFLMNSSIDHFVRTFGYLNTYLGTNTPLPADVFERLSDIDPDAYAMSEWRGLVGCALDAE